LRAPEFDLLSGTMMWWFPGLGRYRDLLDFPAGFWAVPRGFEARAAFRVCFLAAAFAVLAVGFLEALRALIDFAFGFVDLVVDGVVFAFRVVRFLAALIAAPERAPITVPTTGTPSAVPATAPAAAPPKVLPAVPMAVSVPP
jgi:hypothetical protein